MIKLFQQIDGKTPLVHIRSDKEWHIFEKTIHNLILKQKILRTTEHELISCHRESWKSGEHDVFGIRGSMVMRGLRSDCIGSRDAMTKYVIKPFSYFFCPKFVTVDDDLNVVSNEPQTPKLEFIPYNPILRWNTSDTQPYRYRSQYVSG